jgi:hypothetical protein
MPKDKERLNNTSEQPEQDNQNLHNLSARSAADLVAPRNAEQFADKYSLEPKFLELMATSNKEELLVMSHFLVKAQEEFKDFGKWDLMKDGHYSNEFIIYVLDNYPPLPGGEIIFAKEEDMKRVFAKYEEMLGKPLNYRKIFKKQERIVYDFVHQEEEVKEAEKQGEDIPISLPAEVSQSTRTTLCSRTARKNIWAQVGFNPIQLPSSEDVRKYYEEHFADKIVRPSDAAKNRSPRESNVSILDQIKFKGIRCYDCFVKSRSSNGHRVSVVLWKGAYYVQDPYTRNPETGKRSVLPIPLNKYPRRIVFVVPPQEMLV